MLRSRWGGILMLVFLIGLVGCKCGKKPEPTDSSTAGPDYESTVSGLPGAGMVDVARLIPAGVSPGATPMFCYVHPVVTATCSVTQPKPAIWFPMTVFPLAVYIHVPG